MKRPLIAVTVCYMLIIVLLETLDILNKIPAGNVARQAAGDTAVITGKIITEPEETENKTSFVLAAREINGKKTKGNVLVNDYSDAGNFSYGDIVEITGKFFRPDPPTVRGTFDYKKYLFRKRIYAMQSVVQKDDVRIVGKSASPVWQISLKLRRQILGAYKNNLLTQHAAIISGITIGEKSGLTPYIQKIFIDAGVMHVLVVSGSNVAFIAVIFFWIFRSVLRLKKKMSLGLSIPVILIYAMITGANPPILRATIMTLIVILAMLLSRNVEVYQGLFLAALIILIYNPLTLFEAGFQMSFAATLGIIYFFPKLQTALKTYKLPKFFNWFSSIFLVSLAAQITIAPLTAYYFNKVSIIALLSNLVILPMIGILLVAGFALYISSLIGTWLAFIVAKFTGGLVFLITVIVDLFANVPYSTVRTPTPSVYFIMLFYVIAFGLPKIKNYVWKRTVVAAAAVFILLPVWNHFSKNRTNLEISFIDVGLGDAVYCEFPDGSNMLIDGGGNWSAKYDIGETVISPFLWNRGVMKIDTVILTHPHINHYQGLTAVCRNFKIKKFITTAEISDEDEYLELMEVLRKRKIIVERAGSGRHFGIGKITAEVLNPDQISRVSDDNSLVLKLSYKNFSALLCGDITRKTQNILTEKNIAATVLLIPGHGKKKLLLDFLLKISPEYAIISTDMPSSKVLEQLRWSKLFSTSASGTVTVYSDGNTWKIKETLADAPKDMIILNFEYL